ncbi:DMT family transporter [Candidatus Puniceispirillum sp.]|nr:DMT family transporter [Candidatus Puniceispirillum sp.]
MTALCAMLAVFFFSLNDAFMKFLSSGYALHQIVLVRSGIGLLVLLVIFIPLHGTFSVLKTRRLGMHLLRGLAVVFANLTFFIGLVELPLAEATAIFFVSPLLITVFSIIFLKEQVGIHRWASVFFGMLGVLVILRPGTDAFKLASLLPIAAALGYATLHMLTRKMGKTESALTMSFYIQVTFIFISCLFWLFVGDGRFSNADSPALHFLLREWGALSKDDWQVFALVGTSSALGGFLISQAYRKSEAAFVASFEYIAMPLSIFWGILIFNNLPDTQSFFGMAMIVGSGLYIIWREAIRGKEKLKQPLESPRFRR